MKIKFGDIDYNNLNIALKENGFKTKLVEVEDSLTVIEFETEIKEIELLEKIALVINLDDYTIRQLPTPIERLDSLEDTILSLLVI